MSLRGTSSVPWSWHSTRASAIFLPLYRCMAMQTRRSLHSQQTMVAKMLLAETIGRCEETKRLSLRAAYEGRVLYGALRCMLALAAGVFGAE